MIFGAGESPSGRTPPRRGRVTVRGMLRRSPRFWSTLDWAFVAALAGSAAYQLATHPPAEEGWGPRWAVALFLAVTIVPLAWRRRLPFVVVTVVVLGATVQSFTVGDWPSFQVFVALVAALYSVAAVGDRRRALAAAAVTSAALAATQIAQVVEGAPLSDVPGPWVLLAAVWIGGRALRRRRLVADRLADYALELDRRREEEARLAVAEERSRIARELHDVVAHAISVIVVQAQAAQRVLEGEQESARESLTAIEDTGRNALVEMRRLLEMLRNADEDSALTPQPSLAQLDALVNPVRESGLEVDLRVEGEPRPLAPGVDLSAFRIVQEALTNALKHAGPARARVTISYRPNDVELEIVDDGRGAETDEPATGHGLIGMRERAAIVGGAVEAGSANGSGYAVRALLPT